ncbi:hypothetical protein WN943_005678 [Citrus x changshan-huyou]
MPTFAASGSGNISPRQSQLHPASAQVPVATQDHSSIQKPPHDDLKQPPYAQNNALAEPPFAAPGSGNNNSRPPQLHCTSELAPVASNDHSRSREPAIDDLKQSTHSPSSELTEPQLAAHGAGHSPPRTAHLRSAAEQISAAITDQHGFREPTQDDLNQPPPLQLPENMLAAASETSSRVDLISTLTATITAAVEAILRPNLALPTSTSPVQPIPPLITHSTAAAKEQQQPALDIPKTQNPNANRAEAPPEEHQRPVLSDPSQSGDKGKMKQSDIVIQPQQPSSTRFVAISDRRTQGLSTQPPVDLPQAPPIDESRLVDTSPPGGPLDHRASHPGDVTTSPDTMSFGLIDVGIIEIVLELVEKVGVGGLVVDGDDALAEDLQWVDVVNVHRFRGSLILHISEEFHLHRPHVFFFLVFLFPPSLSSDGIEGAGE